MEISYVNQKRITCPEESKGESVSSSHERLYMPIVFEPETALTLNWLPCVIIQDISSFSQATCDPTDRFTLVFLLQSPQVRWIQGEFDDSMCAARRLLHAIARIDIRTGRVTSCWGAMGRGLGYQVETFDFADRLVGGYLLLRFDGAVSCRGPDTYIILSRRSERCVGRRL